MSRNLLYSTVSAASAVLLLVLSSLIASALGQSGWGDFSFALSLALIGEALMDFGIHQVTIRSIARDRSAAPRLFRNSLALKALPGAGMFIIMTGAAWLLRPERDLRLAATLMIASAICRSYLLTVRGVLQGLERFGDDSLVVVADRVLLLAVCGLALWSGAGIVGLAAAFLAARCVAVAAALGVAHRHVGPPQPAFDTALWRDLQRSALPLGAFLIVLNLYSYIDTVILRSLASSLETGLYNSAYRIYEGLSYAPAILSSVLTPRLSHLWQSRRDAHRQLLRNGIAGSVVLAVLLGAVTWVAAPVLLRVIFTGAEGAVPALRILGLGLAFVFVIWILHAAAISVFETRLLLQATLVGSVLNIGANLYLIPRYGRNGAAAATVAGEFVTMIVLAWGLRRVLAGRDTRP